ncbi:MAG TPA: hypothetical protein VJL28_04315 [Gemmatimonadaceae bacterium]|nr:hypothetical protein [Gemmatimonadaceae bacterium]
MESFRYVNIFETKGLEYLLLIIFLVLFVLFVRYLRKSERKPGGFGGMESSGGTRPGSRAGRDERRE